MDRNINIRILDKEINLLGEVDDFTSLSFILKWDFHGEFTIKTSNINKHLLKKGNLIMVNKDKYRVGIIEHAEIKDKAIEIKGFTLSYLLFNRITVPSIGEAYDTYNTYVEDIMIELVNKNSVNTVDIKRKIPNLIIKNSLGRGDKYNFQTRYKNLSEELKALASISGLGWTIYLDFEQRKFVFEVLEGIDLTINQDKRSPMIFSRDKDNVFDRHYITSNIGMKNVAYTAGQGEGAERELIIINSDLSGLDRREMFVDARDIDESESLHDRGLLKLQETKEADSFKNEVSTDGYKSKWNLGDYVTILDKEINVIKHSKVTEVVEVYEGGELTIEPTFGENILIFGEKVKQLLDKPLIENNKTIISDQKPVNGVKGQVWVEIISEEVN